MVAVCIIPARYGAKRFPGKPLARDTGKFLIQHVVENAARARVFDRVIVATDDERIAAAVTSFGGDVRMTRADHASGTDRVAEVAEGLDADVIVNLQGDEPDIRPEMLERLARFLAEHPEADMATLAARCHNMSEALSPNVVKVVMDARGRALYFSRSTIPFDRKAFLTGRSFPFDHCFRHIGVYAYRREFLLRLAALPQTPLEKIESLEQLRALQHGHVIAVAEVDYDGHGIDTPEQYAAFVAAQKLRPT